jgi:hypothetical protein
MLVDGHDVALDGLESLTGLADQFHATFHLD